MEGESRRLRVIMVGLRGFPEVQGGVETHAEHLCPRLAARGIDMEVVVRAPYMRHQKGNVWKGVRYRRIWSPRSKGLEAIVHTFLGVLYAGLKRPDVLHIQAIGPAIMTPIARLLGLKVVVTHHGPDYDRQKWGRFAKAVLKLGERFGMRMSDEAIVISETIRNLVKEKHGVETTLIPNGVELPQPVESTEVLEKFGLRPGRYVLMVTRLVPEKRHPDLIRAFSQAGLDGWKLALVGASDHPDDYTEEVQRLARETDGVVMTGFQKGRALAELYSHAGIFVLPSSHEGLPIALLEALSYGLPVIASDIPANREVGLHAEHYFPMGDVQALARRLQEWAALEWNERRKEETRRWVAVRYDWEDIAGNTFKVYEAVVGR